MLFRSLTFTAAPCLVAPDSPAFRAESFDPGKRLVKISVADTGCGIAAENVKKIFEPYFTTKAQGTGLGLAIVCELVGNYGGLIDAESLPGIGTTISVYLPRAN